MNQTYFEWYEFDVNVARILIATCNLEINVVWSMNDSEQLNFNIVVSRKKDSLLISDTDNMDDKQHTRINLL